MTDDKPPSYDQAVVSASRKEEENSSIHSTHELPVVHRPETIEENRTIRTSNGHTQIYVIQPSATNQALHFRYPQNLYCDQCQRKFKQKFRNKTITIRNFHNKDSRSSTCPAFFSTLLHDVFMWMLALLFYSVLLQSK